MPTWGWLALGGVLAVGVVGAVVLTGDDENGSGASATTVRSQNDSPDTSEFLITAPETESTNSSGDTPLVTDPPSTAPSFTDPTDPAEVVAGAPEGITGDRSNPVPMGAVADIGGGWRLQILDVVPDGAAAVAAESEFNDPPPAGSTFTLVKVALGYFGVNDPTSAFQPTISAVGTANLELGAGCGVLPNELDLFVDVFSGGVLVGNICFVTPIADSTSLQLYAAGDFFQSDQVFLEANGSTTGQAQIAGLNGPQDGAASTPTRLSPTALATAVDLGAGWTMTVTGAARDITDVVMTENQFNDPPPDGLRFIGIDVTYAYSGTGPASAFQIATKAVGDANVQLGGSCGVVPGEVDTFSDLFAGGSVTGTICFVVPSENPNFVVYAVADYESPPFVLAVA